jgi:hypothetical protein
MWSKVELRPVTAQCDACGALVPLGVLMFDVAMEGDARKRFMRVCVPCLDVRVVTRRVAECFAAGQSQEQIELELGFEAGSLDDWQPLLASSRT